jgi:ATP-dependent RNA helicase DDX10/DBP4
MIGYSTEKIFTYVKSKHFINPNESSYNFVARRFDELPLSKNTMRGLRESEFIIMTVVQRVSLPHSLNGRDILGSAKTGSGKTLAFLLPLVERLHSLDWEKNDRLGGIIIPPTRELAMQLFDELWKIGKYHKFSAGLTIGGKCVKEETSRICHMNILIGTPGRLLQHMDESPDFDASRLQILAIDETDRVLDLGFSRTLNAIIDGLPHKRQTLLFSATQYKNIKKLARLHLNNPEYISVHACSTATTPTKLKQTYTICKLQEKIDFLWSFIKNNLKCKTIVFLSTCKQVRFIFESFTRLKPGIKLRCLNGKMKQMKRLLVYYQFCASNEMLLFATDIASRGLDFPAVDWVLQVDCPEDISQYIHRVGRAARYKHRGHAMIFILPSEKRGMLLQFEENKIPIKFTQMNSRKKKHVTPALRALILKEVELRDMAELGLISYVNSISMMKNKDIFDVKGLPLLEFAFSLGLSTVPHMFQQI